MSRESNFDLRYTLMAHESWHGIYFCDEAFRDFIEKCFQSFEKKSRDFLIGYWKCQPTLGYDVNDDYLLKNEFMAYLMQRHLSLVKDWYISHSRWNSVQKAMPELSAYVINTGAQTFYDEAAVISGYAFDRWGMAAGRTYLVSREGTK